MPGRELRGAPARRIIGAVPAWALLGSLAGAAPQDAGAARAADEPQQWTRGITYGIAESSWIHQPQIEEIVELPAPRVVPIQKLPLDPAERKGFLPTPRRYASFDGISHTGWVPPDPCLAVGPNHVLQTVNMKVAWYDKAGTLQFSVDLGSPGNPGFFENLGAGGFTFDPKCFYDEHAGRFVVLCFEVYGNNESWIDIAVSDDSDPNGTWYKYRMDSVTWVGGTSYWVDYPGLGYDDDVYLVTGNLFGLSAGGWAGVKFRVIDKASILSGGAATWWDLRDGGLGSVQVAECHTAPGTIYAVSTGGSGTILVHAIRNETTSPSLVTTSVSVPSYNYPPGAPELGGGTIDTLDGRIINVEFGNGRLVAGHGIDAGDGRCLARWYEFKTNNWPGSSLNPSLHQSGEVDLGPGVYTYFPGIARQTNGDLGMIVAYSSASEYAGLAVAVNRTTDTPGTLGLIEKVKLGAGSASGRWGDYFDACIDPADPAVFWGVGEFPNWTTHIAEFDAVPTVPTSGLLYSTRAAATVGNLTVEPGDIVHLDPVTGVHTMFLDLSDVIPSGSPNVDAFAVLPDGSVLLSFEVWQNIPGLVGGPTGPNFGDEDIVRFVPSSLGEFTAGAFDFYFDGTDVGCGGKGEDVDALAVDASGNLWISFSGNFFLPGNINGYDEDILQFTPTSLGSNTAGSWSWILMGRDTDVKLAQTPENTDALDFDVASGTLTLSTIGNFIVPVNVQGQNRDLFTFAPTQLGFDAAGTWSFTLDGDAYGLSAADIDGIEILP